MKRAGYDHTVKIFHVEQAPVIIEGLNAGRHLPGLVSPPRVDVGDSDQLRIRNRQNLLEQILTAAADSNHPNAHTIVRAQHSGCRHC